MTTTTIDTSKLSRATLEGMVKDLGGTNDASGTFGGRVRGVGRVPAATAPFAAEPIAAPKRASKRSKRKPTKRDPAVVDALTAKLGAYIAENPGQSIETIGKAIKATTAQLATPMKRLRANGTVKKSGDKRSSVYLPVKLAAKTAAKTVAKRAPAKVLNGAAAHAN